MIKPEDFDKLTEALQSDYGTEVFNTADYTGHNSDSYYKLRNYLFDKAKYYRTLYDKEPQGPKKDKYDMVLSALADIISYGNELAHNRDKLEIDTAMLGYKTGEEPINK